MARRTGSRLKLSGGRKPRRAAAAPDETTVLPGRRPVIELLRSGAGAEKVLIARELDPSKTIAEIRKLAQGAAVPVRVVPRTEVDRLAGGSNHQGVVAITGRYRYAPLDRLLAAEAPRLLFVDGVTDPHNLGSLLRSADGAGFTGVVVPSRRSAAVNATVRRVAAGAAEVVPVARVDSLRAAVSDARAAGLWLAGLSERGAEDLWTSPLLEPPVGLVVGAEDRGLSRGIQEACDALVRIPSAGRLDALNVAVAGAIAMFEVARRAAPGSAERDSATL